jgi:hypothetical protein
MSRRTRRSIWPSRQPARVQPNFSGVTGTSSTGKDVAVHVNFGANVDTRVGWIMREEILQKAYDALESAGHLRCQNTFNAEAQWPTST